MHVDSAIRNPSSCESYRIADRNARGNDASDVTFAVLDLQLKKNKFGDKFGEISSGRISSGTQLFGENKSGDT